MNVLQKEEKIIGDVFLFLLLHILPKEIGEKKKA